MAGPFDSLHVKRRTAGSSNELSFDVLDAAGAAHAGQKRRASRMPSAPKPSQGTYHGIAGTARFSNAPEVTRRKRERQARSIRAGTVVVAIAVVLVAVGAFAGTRFYHDRIDFSGRFANLVGQFIEVDQTLAPIDGLMVSPFDTAEADERDAMLGQIPDLERSLDGIAQEAESISSSAMMGVDQGALDQVRAAAAARKDMLSAADSIFTLAVVVNKHVAEANDAWSKVLSADSTAREATEMFNGATAEAAAREALGKTNDAIDEMNAARSALSQLEREASGVDLSAELAYVDKRLESLAAAADTSEALLANDRAAASEANSLYNAADQQAATLAAGLDTSIADKVREPYSGDIERAQQLYDDARSRATTADSAIRTYL